MKYNRGLIVDIDDTLDESSFRNNTRYRRYQSHVKNLADSRRSRYKKLLSEARKQNRYTTEENIFQALWRRGILEPLVRPYQLPLYNHLHKVRNPVLSVTRQWGKTVVTFCFLFEQAIRRPNCRILMVYPSEGQIKGIVDDLYRIATTYKPLDYHIKSHTGRDGKYTFPNGSTLEFIGANKQNIKSARGKHLDIIVIDECLIIDDLDSAIKNVLLPTFTEASKRDKEHRERLILSSSLPQSPEHDFFEYINRAREDGSLFVSNIEDNKTISTKIAMQQAQTYGGMDNNQYRREILGIFEADDSAICIPELINDEIKNSMFLPQKTIMAERNWKTDGTSYRTVACIDWGTGDNCGIVAGLYDETNAKLYIDNEFARTGLAISQQIIQLMKMIKEYKQYKESGIRKIQLFCDINPSAINEGLLMGCNLIARKQAQVRETIDFTRNKIRDNRIIVTSNCPKLKQETIGAYYNARKLKNYQYEVARNKKHRHFDVFSALTILVSCLSWIPYGKNNASMSQSFKKNYNVALSGRKRQFMDRMDESRNSGVNMSNVDARLFQVFDNKNAVDETN